MLEVEMKFRVDATASVEERLAAWGARPEAARREVDRYFNAPDRDFARTDEAVRVRQIGPKNFVTYKGPKRDLQTKTRTELEVPLADGAAIADDFAQLLKHLGYRPVEVVKKTRRIFHLAREGFDIEICLDDVDGLGTFAELEIQAPEEKLGPARDLIQRLAAELGLSGSERRSYLELLLSRTD
jgi:adenylate cyclase class 2